MFLRERDKARARGDYGVDRSLTADLRRLGVPDDATATDPTGLAEKRAIGRPRKPRCEHGQVADRCDVCNEETLMVAAPFNSRLKADD